MMMVMTMTINMIMMMMITLVSHSLLIYIYDNNVSLHQHKVLLAVWSTIIIRFIQITDAFRKFN